MQSYLFNGMINVFFRKPKLVGIAANNAPQTSKSGHIHIVSYHILKYSDGQLGNTHQSHCFFNPINCLVHFLALLFYVYTHTHNKLWYTI